MGIVTISQGCENLNKPEAVRTVSDGARPQLLVLNQCPPLNLVDSQVWEIMLSAFLFQRIRE